MTAEGRSRARAADGYWSWDADDPQSDPPVRARPSRNARDRDRCEGRCGAYSHRATWPRRHEPLDGVPPSLPPRPRGLLAGPLGGACSPALLFACGCLIRWGAGSGSRESLGGGSARPHHRSPPDCAVLASYVAACWRLGNHNEVSLATLARTSAWRVGVESCSSPMTRSTS